MRYIAEAAAHSGSMKGAVCVIGVLLAVFFVVAYRK